MKEIFEGLIQNKNFLMFSAAMSYILGLYACFTDKSILFASIVTITSIVLLLKNFPAKIVFLWITMFYLAFLNAHLRIKNYDELYKLAPADCIINGQIISVPDNGIANTSKFFFLVNELTLKNGKTITHGLPNKVLVNLNSNDSLLIGNYCEINGKLRKPFKATNPSQFSYGNYLKNFQTYTVFYAENITSVNSKLSLNRKIIRYLNIKRNEIISSHSRFLKSPNLEILGGVVFGDDAVAPPDYIKTSFINSGLLHILAASGMNVAFISGFLFFFLRRFNTPYNIRILSGIFVIVLYSLMTGLGASVIRAALMLIFILLGKLIDRDAHSVSLLSFVGLLMLIYNPAYINDVGFQLSFIVTFGLLVCTEPVLKHTPKLPAWLAGAIAIPVIAQLWVIPVQMFYFNTISTYSVFANIISVPFLSIISFGGFVSCVLSLFSPIANITCRVFDFFLNPLINVIVHISAFFSKLPHSIFITTHPSVIQILIYYLILLLITVIIKENFKNTKIILYTVLISIGLLLSSFIHIPNHNFEIIAFDAGNADMFLLKTPANKYFIIDSGKSGYRGRRSQAEVIILKYLKDKGIRNIQGLIITHFDDDHAGGGRDLINKLKIEKVYLNSMNDEKPLAQKIYKSIDKKKTNAVLAENDEVIYREEDFEIRTYLANFPENDGIDNENSVITLVKYKNYTSLFMGDAGYKAFNELKTKLPKNVILLKAGHHGARSSLDKDMAAYLNPRVSIVSVGYNRYGHPDPYVLKLLSGGKIVRTDRINSIKTVFNNDGYVVYGFDSKSRKYYKKFKG